MSTQIDDLTSLAREASQASRAELEVVATQLEAVVKHREGPEWSVRVSFVENPQPAVTHSAPRLRNGTPARRSMLAESTP